MPVLIHDGRRNGHLGWVKAAIKANISDGAVITPFHTPPKPKPCHPPAKKVAKTVRKAKGEVVFDAMTHAALLSTTTNWDTYDEWHLWGPSGKGLDSEPRRDEHVKRVFKVQKKLKAPCLTPTLALDNPTSPDAQNVLLTAQLGRTSHQGAWQSLAGTRTFFRAGADLDSFVGSLVSLRAPVWVVTLINEKADGFGPQLDDAVAIAGLLRTIHSLSIRSRVIFAQSDFAGLPAIAAGADTVGSGWDKGQRTFDPLAFVASDGSIKRQGQWVTQGGLMAVLREPTAQTIAQFGTQIANAMLGRHSAKPTRIPGNGEQKRTHHLKQLHREVTTMLQFPDRGDRVAELRHAYGGAELAANYLNAAGPRVVTTAEVQQWINYPRRALRAYATDEGIWG